MCFSSNKRMSIDRLKPKDTGWRLKKQLDLNNMQIINCLCWILCKLNFLVQACWSVGGWSYSIEIKAARVTCIVWPEWGYNYTRLAGPSAACQTGAPAHPGPRFNFIESVLCPDDPSRHKSGTHNGVFPQSPNPFTKPCKDIIKWICTCNTGRSCCAATN